MVTDYMVRICDFHAFEADTRLAWEKSGMGFNCRFSLCNVYLFWCELSFIRASQLRIATKNKPKNFFLQHGPFTGSFFKKPVKGFFHVIINNHTLFFIL